MSKIRESATATRRGPGRILLTLISPGKGSSGSYTPEVLAKAAEERAFPRGTLGMIDHDTDTERFERPEGSLRNLAIALEEDAYIGEGGALQAEAKVATAWRDLVDDFHEHIGASISASADISVSESGQKIVERIVPNPFNRTDLVTVAGRGGKIEQVLEAARVIESRSVVKEATADDIRLWLSAAVRDAHASEDTWAYLQDHDDTYVYFDTGRRTYRQEYALNGVNVILSGDPVEVRRRVEYDPVTATAVAESQDSPPVPAGATTNQEEANMATIDDKELAELRESAGRATAAEAELKKEREERAAEAKTARKDKAEAIAKEAFGEDVPAFFLNAATMLAESSDFDPEKLRADATEAAAKIAVDHGAGTPRGLGDTVTESKTRSDDDVVNAL